MATWYTKDHEWVRIDGDTATVGISRHAQEQLGDIVFIELPEIGREVSQGDSAAVVESVKAASEVYARVSGGVVAVNEAVEGTPVTVTGDPAGQGWLLRFTRKYQSDYETLIREEQSQDFVKSIG